ncbi:MAG: hypothetical protein ABF564_08865 [Zymomonas mobilis]
MSAIPLPITPTVLTVLTRASTLASSRLPCVKIIIRNTIPVGHKPED